jgi:hypothetical protein
MRKSELIECVEYAFGNSFVRIGQRAVEIEVNVFRQLRDQPSLFVAGIGSDRNATA